MKRSFKPAKLKKGFTLVEMIIAMALTAILMAAVMTLFSSVSGIIKGLKGDVNLDVTTDTITQYIFDRMATSTNFSVKLNTLIDDPSDPGSGKKIIDPAECEDSVNNLLAERKDPATEDLYGMVIMDGKLYDLGVIDDYSEFEAKVNDYRKYRLFNDEFYGDAHFKYTFSPESSEGSSTLEWYHVGVIPYDEEGNPLMSERSELFKLINLQYSKFTPDIDGVFYTTNPDNTTERTPEDNGVVILYRIKDYTKVTSAPSLTPDPAAPPAA